MLQFHYQRYSFSPRQPVIPDRRMESPRKGVNESSRLSRWERNEGGVKRPAPDSNSYMASKKPAKSPYVDNARNFSHHSGRDAPVHDTGNFHGRGASALSTGNFSGREQSLLGAGNFSGGKASVHGAANFSNVPSHASGHFNANIPVSGNYSNPQSHNNAIGGYHRDRQNLPQTHASLDINGISSVPMHGAHGADAMHRANTMHHTGQPISSSILSDSSNQQSRGIHPSYSAGSNTNYAAANNAPYTAGNNPSYGAANNASYAAGNNASYAAGSSASFGAGNNASYATGSNSAWGQPNGTARDGRGFHSSLEGSDRRGGAPALLDTNRGGGFVSGKRKSGVLQDNIAAGKVVLLSNVSGH